MHDGLVKRLDELKDSGALFTRTRDLFLNEEGIEVHVTTDKESPDIHVHLPESGGKYHVLIWWDGSKWELDTARPADKDALCGALDAMVWRWNGLNEALRKAKD